ncbi:MULTISPECIES: PepSY domain-containing protein [unclassified Paracoccus (in: a-proteobacteria)]|uniref:PepSY domain-containing protein n=1 Tax=unclassified Paracoccus (in: a-proteobacteria) TaxID=2688777 RepID=UPI0016049904|nr:MULTISPECIES: hypothetical protein [unclassified Paracoccus (in: a-proteobacteria)]MBB1492243.1 hypothetical protein [Paracoccus sp. MC1854]MBB1498675.1 hypothetical protein [Paracoccus sp. MC1862]QQO45637.1 hypothetical protein JGR78_04640 [Paracoccus sp. MC1862]
MRLSLLIAAVLVGLALLVVTRDRQDRHDLPRPPAGMVAIPRPQEPGPWDDQLFRGRVDEVMPMHKAVRLVMRRFDGKVLDIALMPAPRADVGRHPLIYHIRILTDDRDVLDIRMDALTGQFLELRGEGITDARRTPRND